MNFFSIALFSALVLTVSCKHYVYNIAQDKPAWQSSNYKNRWFAGLAVDGKTSGVFGHRSCTHTNRAGVNFWAVDLMREYDIEEVTIFNRARWGNRLGNFVVSVGPSMSKLKRCRHYRGIAKNSQVFHLKCHFRKVRYVLLTNHRNTWLTLCEVQVWGHRSDGYDESYIVSKGGKAKQSSVYYWGGRFKRHMHARLALDGNTSSYFGTCACTNIQWNPWWEIDLKGSVVIERIVIFNRLAAGPRMMSLQVRTKTRRNGKYQYFNAIKEFAAGGGIFHLEHFQHKYIHARYVRLRLPYIRNYLTICEVRIYGYHD